MIQLRLKQNEIIKSVLSKTHHNKSHLLIKENTMTDDNYADAPNSNEGNYIV
jgi:hypothetical protein